MSNKKHHSNQSEEGYCLSCRGNFRHELGPFFGGPSSKLFSNLEVDQLDGQGIYKNSPCHLVIFSVCYRSDQLNCSCHRTDMELYIKTKKGLQLIKAITPLYYWWAV